MGLAALSVIIPAAGASKRLGQAKQLVKYKGKPLIQNAINVAHSITPLEIIVVTGAHAKAVKDAAQYPSANWIHNPYWSAGMGGSIALAAAAINPEASGLMILLCDQYRVDSNDLQTLAETWQSDPHRIVAARSDGRLMPPVILPSSCFDALRKLQGDQGARNVLKNYPKLITPVPMKNAAYDLDTQPQLEILETNQDKNRL